jgi:hypothetical protein
MDAVRCPVTAHDQESAVDATALTETAQTRKRVLERLIPRLPLQDLAIGKGARVNRAV